MIVPQAIKDKTLEMILFTAAFTFGLAESMNDSHVSLLDYFTDGLYLSAPAVMVAYEQNGNFEKSLTRLGIPLYSGEMAGQVTMEIIKRHIAA